MGFSSSRLITRPAGSRVKWRQGTPLCLICAASLPRLLCALVSAGTARADDVPRRVGAGSRGRHEHQKPVRFRPTRDAVWSVRFGTQTPAASDAQEGNRRGQDANGLLYVGDRHFLGFLSRRSGIKIGLKQTSVLTGSSQRSVHRAGSRLVRQTSAHSAVYHGPARTRCCCDRPDFQAVCWPH